MGLKRRREGTEVDDTNQQTAIASGRTVQTRDSSPRPAAAAATANGTRHDTTTQPAAATSSFPTTTHPDRRTSYAHAPTFQHTRLHQYTSPDDAFSTALTTAISSGSTTTPSASAAITTLATMLATRNIRPSQLQALHFHRSSNANFKRQLDAAVAAVERDPRTHTARQDVMAWRVDHERKMHEDAWGRWYREDLEAWMRGRGGGGKREMG